MKLFRGSAALLIVTVLLSIRPAPALTANAVQIENAKPGTTEWKITNTGATSGVIEGYASLTSVNRGGQIALFVNTAEPSYKMDIFRVGYYGGAGGRRMLSTVTRTGLVQPKCPEQLDTGLIECDWVSPYILNIHGSADPPDWVSGDYQAKLAASTS